MAITVNPALYRGGGGATSSHLTAAQSAQARAYQAEFARHYGVWYRAAPPLHTLTGKGHKAKKAKAAPKLHRHGTALAAGATRDPFQHRGAAQGF